MKLANTASKKRRIRLTIDDVIKTVEVQRADPERYARSPRLEEALALFWELVDQSKRERQGR